MISNRPLPFLVSLLSGLMLALGFAPYHYFSLSLTGVFIFFLVLQFQSWQKSFFLGLLFAIGLLTPSIYWVYFAIKDVIHLSFIVSILLTALLILSQSFFYGCICAFHGRFLKAKGSLVNAFSFSLLWGLSETCRSIFLGGFPWVFIGDAQTHSALSPLLPIIGSPGTGMFFIFLAALMAVGFYHLNEPSKTMHAKGFFLLSLMMVLFLIPLSLTSIEWTTPKNEKPISVSLIQANIEGEKKEDIMAVNGILAAYEKATNAVKSQLIVWPESILSFSEEALLGELLPIYQSIIANQQTLILGLATKADDNDSYYNSLIKVDANKAIYHKKHLVPFGEMIPLWGINTYLKKHHFSVPPFIKGKKKQIIMMPNLSLSPFICYDVAFSDSANDVNADALITLTDDSWYQKSNALYQHRQMVIARAIEQGKEHIFASNNGLSAIIDNKGHIRKEAPIYQKSTLSSEVYAYQGQTPWHQLGFFHLNLITLVLLVICLIL